MVSLTCPRPEREDQHVIIRAAAIAAVVLLSAFVGASGAARNPDAPITIPLDETSTFLSTSLCAFPVTIESHIVGKVTL